MTEDLNPQNCRSFYHVPNFWV